MSEVYELLRSAAMRRQPVAALYDGQPRVLCPHGGGWKDGRRNVFCYQFGGRSNSIEPLPPEGKGVWRCLRVERLSQVQLHTGNGHTESRSKRQTCRLRRILIATLSQEAIRKTDSEAVPVVSGAPG